MRISGGLARGVPLMVPKGDGVRPATDGLRQAVFSSLGARVVGARFLDLFAGSGAYGLEALSRGASGGVFVERSHKALECLRRNLVAVQKSLESGKSFKGDSHVPPSGFARTNAADITVLAADASTAPMVSSPPSLVFVDPPYELIAQIAGPLFVRLSELLPPSAEALVVFEMPGEVEISPAGWRLLKRLGKGGRQPNAVFLAREPR